jgi:pimeloyl-ACP methyl ester carboxylesterase
MARPGLEPGTPRSSVGDAGWRIWLVHAVREGRRPARRSRESTGLRRVCDVSRRSRHKRRAFAAPEPGRCTSRPYAHSPLTGTAQSRSDDSVRALIFDHEEPLTIDRLGPVPRLDAEITLQDGRRLAFHEWGDRTGPPVFLFHGTPGSGIWCPDERATDAAAVRLIGVDRPGIGGSDVKVARTIGDWPNDVLELADVLGIERFSVVGVSAGGIYAAACAAKIPSRLDGVGVVSARALGENNFAERPEAVDELDGDERLLYELAQRDPLAAAELAGEQEADWVRGVLERPESVWEGSPDEHTSEGDTWFFDDERRTRALYEEVVDGLRQGVEGFRWEAIDVLLPWGFRLDEISIPVHIWYGVQDPRFQGRGRELLDWVASRIPDCRLTAWPDAGHMGMAKHWDEILATL